MNTNISVIIPFLNEKENIINLVSSLNNFFKNSPLSHEVIFVDDGSTDSSFELLNQQEHRHYSAKFIKLSRNFGSHAALRAGILNASGDYITFIYADLQDPLELIEKLFKKCQEGNEIAWAVRETTEQQQSLFSRTYAYLMQKFAIETFPKSGFDIVMFSKKVQVELNKNIENNSSIFLQILTLGFKQVYISYKKAARKAGVTKWTLKKKIKLFVDSFVAFSYAPIRFVTLIGIIFFILGMIWTVYIILREIFVHDLAPGWPALFSVLMLGFGITNISLGIIAEYLWRTLDASRHRPTFIIEDIKGIEIEKNKH